MKHWLLTAVAIATTLASAPGVRAQPPGGPMPEEIRARMQAWQKWRSTHKNVTALQQTMHGIQMLERDQATRLSKAQARKLLGILHTWRPKKTMSDAQAEAVNKQIAGMLTPAQRKILTRSRGPEGPGGPPPGGMGGPPPPDDMGGPPPGGPGGPLPGGMGGPPPSGFGPRPDRPSMSPRDFPSPKEYNPLNPDTLPFVRAREMEKRRLDELTISLKKRVK
jgi:hypothetical protein